MEFFFIGKKKKWVDTINVSMTYFKGGLNLRLAFDLYNFITGPNLMVELFFIMIHVYNP